ncbi:hypothetical protein ACS0TY_017129 [Phlomoides rotata]
MAFSPFKDKTYSIFKYVPYANSVIKLRSTNNTSFQSHANRLPVTIQYPNEKLITSERFRGRIHFEYDKCIACEKRLLNYNIDFRISIFCGNYIEYCPTNCLSMTEKYELSAYDRHELNYNQISLGRLPVSIIEDYTIRTISSNLPQIKNV